MKKKKTFVLLEILIAFALVTISVLPFLHYPFRDMKKEIDLLFQMELEKIAQKELTKWEIKLYKKDSDLGNRIFANKKTKAVYKINKNFEVKLSEKIKRKYIKKTSITWTRQKQSDDRILWVLAKIELQFYLPKIKKPILTTKSEIVARKKI